jgi:2-C-methyl-D-erythritol 4-phosphate cytidylyltransferase
MSVSLILLAGGHGTRFGSPLPKQYHSVAGKLIALYSFDFFLDLPEIAEIIVVCEDSYRPIFSSSVKPIHFALPGKRRQDSVFSGLQKVAASTQIVCIHDAARPFPEKSSVLELLEDCKKFGAATVGAAITSTIKECDTERNVQKTLNRDALWEIQTPQAVKKELLEEAFTKAYENSWDVTDDVSLIERLGKPVKITPGPKKNFKITTPFDLQLAEFLCKNTN